MPNTDRFDRAAQLPRHHFGNLGAASTATRSGAACARNRCKVAGALADGAAYLTIGDAKAMTDDHVGASVKSLDQDC